METTTTEAKMHTSKSVRFADLQPGMRLAVHTREGIEAGRTIATAGPDEDGGYTVMFTDGTTLYEDPYRISNDSSIGIATKA